jgi:cholest-4-en-3-one 26-monooxygenase
VTFDDRLLKDPDVYRRMEHHELFSQLRAEDPVHWTEEEDGPGFWSITKHADLRLINRDAEGFSSEEKGVYLMEPDGFADGYDMRGKIMLLTDPPKHTRYRLLVNKGFTPRMVGMIEQHLHFRSELIVDAVIEQGECEFVTDVAAELPLQAIAEIMGVPERTATCCSTGRTAWSAPTTPSTRATIPTRPAPRPQSCTCTPPAWVRLAGSTPVTTS